MTGQWSRDVKITHGDICLFGIWRPGGPIWPKVAASQSGLPSVRFRSFFPLPRAWFFLSGTTEVKADPSKWSPGRTQWWRSFESIGLSETQIEVACNPFFFLRWAIRQVIFCIFLVKHYVLPFGPLLAKISSINNFQMKAKKRVGHRNVDSWFNKK